MSSSQATDNLSELGITNYSVFTKCQVECYFSVSLSPSILIPKHRLLFYYITLSPTALPFLTLRKLLPSVCVCVCIYLDLPNWFISTCHIKCHLLLTLLLLLLHPRCACLFQSAGFPFSWATPLHGHLSHSAQALYPMLKDLCIKDPVW